MSNYYYEDGAKHYDHHKEVTVNLKSATDAKSILREILADDIEDTDYEEIGFADEYAEQPATSEPIRTAHRNSGGGRKPYRQKGTGHARQGSIRAAQWRKGGIVFGPTPRDYSFKINRKERVLALKSALVNKLNEKKLMVIDNLKLDNFKTKTGVELLNNLKLDGKVLFVASEEAENLYMATRNLNNVLVLFPDEINVYDILNADYVVFDEASIKMVEEALK